jgi:hypothetical protein
MSLKVKLKPGSLMKQLALNGSAAVGVLHGVTGRSGSFVALGCSVWASVSVPPRARAILP